MKVAQIQKDSLYVPYFAPDEGDKSDNNWNNYLKDKGIDEGGISICRKNDVYALSDGQNPYFNDGQSLLCKYKADIIATTVPGHCRKEEFCDSNNYKPAMKDRRWSRNRQSYTDQACEIVTVCEPEKSVTTTSEISISTSQNSGPNKGCDILSVSQLTTDRNILNAKIDEMRATGTTNLVSAVMWSWKTISPNSPYANFKTIQPYDKQNHQKVIVLMTDGDNTWFDGSEANKSQYGPFGYAWNNRLGTATNADGTDIGTVLQNNTESRRSTFMDAKTLEACKNAKAAGVKIFTVGFAEGGSGISSDGQALLRACASTPSNYYLATNSGALLAAFMDIGNSLQGLHISR
jgi:hypothetical protein